MKNHDAVLSRSHLLRHRAAVRNRVFWIFAFCGGPVITFLAPGHAAAPIAKLCSPADSAWCIVLVSPEEPGEPMIVTGTVYATDGKTPAPGIEVHVYHTDAEGYYRKGNNNSSNPRLQGTMITDAHGKYEYRTIRPAPYPGGRVPAHVHYVISRCGHDRQYEELQFAGDPILGKRGELTTAQEGDTFGTVRPLRRDEGDTWRVVKDFRLRD